MRTAVILLCTLFCFYTSAAQHKTTYVFVGTYTDEKPDKGIYVYSLDLQSGDLKELGSAESVINPSFLTVSPDGRFLYACTDTRQAIPGSITSFKIDSIHGKLLFLNKQSARGANPVYLTTDGNNKFIVNGNYTEGNVSVATIDAQGGINPSIQTILFKDSSINKSRQEKSHIHSTIFSPRFDYLYLPDLGADKIRVFKFNPANPEPLAEIDSLTVHTEPGSGPRHMVFHPNERFAYCVEEMGGMVSAYAYNSGKLTRIQRIPSYSQQAAEHSSADIHISPDGKFLYASNRIENTLSIFSIHADGTLKLVGHQSTFGEIPRNFAIDPSGYFVLVANQTSNNLVVFKRDPLSGLLKRAGKEIKVPHPSCIKLREYGR
ncbi:MAG: lactonase family protein [Williamsia sp.]|nr:lactonase family protein [Williamsia sp.]